MRLLDIGSGLVLLAAGGVVVFLVGQVCRSRGFPRRTGGRTTPVAEPRTSSPDVDAWDGGLMGKSAVVDDDPGRTLDRMVAIIGARPIERIGRLELRSLSMSLFLAIDRAADPASGTPAADDAIAAATRLHDELVREERRRERRAAAR